MSGSQPLDGVTVLDLSEWIAGPNCTKQLADFGARVVKVERPDGDPARRMGPFPGDVPGDEPGGMFLHLNTNKEGVVVDLQTETGAGIVGDLSRLVDIVVESFLPGTLDRLGLAPASMIAANPDLVVTSVTGFGQDGPYARWETSELVAFAMGGPMNASGNPDREPVKLAASSTLMQSGATAATATLGAYYWAVERGEGQHVDVASFETQNGSLDRRRYYLLSYEYSGTVGERAAVVGAGRPAAGGRFVASDGKQVTTSRIWPDHVHRMVKVLGDDHLEMLWERSGIQMMSDEAEYINSVIAKWVARRTSRQAMREAQAGGWPIVVVNDPKLLLEDDHFAARGFFDQADHPQAGTLRYTGAPFRIDGGGWTLGRTAPLLGQDTDDVLAELLGYSDSQLTELRRQRVIG